MKIITDYLDQNVIKYPENILFEDKSNTITYEQFRNVAYSIASNLLIFHNQPIAIYMDKSIECIAAMFGVLYSGNFYTIMDTKMPLERLNTILDTLKPALIITDQKYKEKINYKSLIYEELTNTEINLLGIQKATRNIVSTDPMYVLFTSGSTGVPKGVILSHQACVSYVKWFTECFHVNQSTVFGSGTPLYFSMSVSDLFSTVYAGAKFVLIPHVYFSFPIKLIEYLNEKKVNTTYWVPSAYQLVVNVNVFDTITCKYLKTMLFAGETMNPKVLKAWLKNNTISLAANLFGPTETTDICTYYIIKKDFDDNRAIPIGKPCENVRAYVVQDGKLITEQEQVGELYVGGPFLASGYYNNTLKTKSTFIENPFQTNYPEILYKTGDLVKYNNENDLMYMGRADFQIKHLGYRIELGEIEANVNKNAQVLNCVCIYSHDKIYLYYEGSIEIEEMRSYLSLKVPTYMIPEQIIKIEHIMYNRNGKIDRAYYKEISK